MAFVLPSPLSRTRGKEGRSTLNEIDTQISAYKGKLFELTAQRNALQPITSLPPEILSVIFRTCVTTAEREAWELGGSPNVSELQYTIFSSFKHAYARAALHLSHVCRTWRAIARNDAILWTHLPTFSEELCKRMLVRSKKAPLSVRSFIDRDFAALRLALSDVSRIKLLHLTRGPGLSIPRNLIDFLMTPAPALEKLLLFNTAHHPGPAGEGEIMPDGIFGGVVPRLSELLVYEGPQILWTSPLLKSPVLTKLQVGGMSSWRKRPLEEFLRILESMPQLESLSLNHSIPMHSPPPGRVVEMPRLRKISFSDGHNRCMSLLACLSLSPATSMDIRSSLPDVSSIRTDLLSTFEQTKRFFVGIRSVAFDVPTQRVFSKLQLRCWTAEITGGDLWDLSNCTALKVQFTFAWPHSAELDPVRIALDADSIVDFSAVDTIAIGVRDNAPTALCRSLFCQFEMAHTVCLNWSTLHTMLTVFESQSLPTIQRHGRQRPYSPIFPCAHTLALDMTRIRTQDLERLKAFIAARPALQSLRLKMCMVKKSVVNKLRELVPEVVWDGRMGDRHLFHLSGIHDEDSVDEDGDNLVLLPMEASAIGSYDDEP